jgi:putative endonuclease
MPTWYVYILNCADNTFYTGIATDVERRLQEHNEDNKTGAKYTRARRPVKLVYHEQCVSRSEAAKREYEIKQLDRQAKEALIQRDAKV